MKDIFMRAGVHWVPYYGGHLYLVSTVCEITIWRHIYVLKPTFWRSLLTQYVYSSTCALLILRIIALNINYQRSKLSGCVLKQGSKTHSSLCQSNLQLQNQIAPTYRRIRAAKHRCGVGAHAGLQDRILLNYKKTFVFCYV